MPQPVIIENEALLVQVWPRIGGKVSSIIDKADRHELLFAYPSEIPTAPQYDQPYQSSWYQGWDECFPAVASSRYVGHPYDGIPVPDHGELFALPTHSAPSANGITTTWHGLRFGYELTRSLSLQGASLLATYTLHNLAPFPFRFVWAQHALLAIAGEPELSFAVPGGGGALPFRLSRDHTGQDLRGTFEWPTASPGLDISAPARLPSRVGWKVFSEHPIATPATLRYPGRGRVLTIEYSSEDSLPAYWGVWVNTGAWAGHKHIAVEPTTGRFDHIDRAVRDGSAGRVGASAKLTWTVRWTVGPIPV